MSTEFLSEFSYAGDLEKEKTREDLIKFYEQELQIDPDDEKERDQSHMKIKDCLEDFELEYQQVLQKGFHPNQAAYFQGLVEAYENEIKENKYFKEEEEERTNYESLEEDLEFEYEKVLNQFQEKKELKDELVKAYEMKMVEIEDVHVIKETEDFVESHDQLEWKYYQALEKGINANADRVN